MTQSEFDTTSEKGAFDKDTLHRIVTEASRLWVVEHFLRTGRLPEELTMFAYPSGPVSMDWGNPTGGSTNPHADACRPASAVLHRKRVVVHFTLEDYPAPSPDN